MEELLAPIVIFFIYGGAALAIIVIIIRSFLNKNHKKPFLKWIIVVILSLCQAGCWHIMDNFGSSFGSGSQFTVLINLLLLIPAIWLIHQIATHYFINKPESEKGANGVGLD